MDPQSLRITPSTQPDSTNKSIAETVNSFGVHDTFRYGPKSIATDILPKHPLEHRLKHWEETQTNLKFTLERRIYGIHAPVRQLMERSIVSRVQRAPILPSSNLSLEVLMGKDETIDFEDFLNVPELSTDMMDMHASMEHKLGIKL
ncbi:unnamed protein product [Rhizophagus irregularis]|uniref:Proteasome maturation factor UMP1 n=1 Tax=Rhizophagus irregularis TaxID=588596 RepID=A0A2I1FSF1_9GLOM|nr:proteasome maturation factor UMP1 [Rhizophagus irregularis]RGB37117.1 proteasome maturation factor UMP1 [Rhizophagus diaphanus] [Rhizophagus sp. MUCL 43196]GBC51485.1 proteasome maturation factor UMP1 [Rhizophagus irregularis DAOM 181602=DAOM 197198]UZO27286.1 hypothetical protein OCT59_019488 [Rhizophagus irregularis]CAB4396664.1 unnamed protein product [Rhizophagus irregularis]